MFDSQPVASEAKALGKETGEAITKLVAELSALEEQIQDYLFLAAITPVATQLREVVSAVSANGTDLRL